MKLTMLSEEIHRKKCQRYNIPGHAHELTFSCYRRQVFLLNDSFCSYLVEAIIRAKEIHQFDLWAYVFMPEHIHLLIWPRNEIYSISNILLSIKQSVSRKVLLYLRKHKPQKLKLMETSQKHTLYRFWQAGGGYDRNITSRTTVIHVIEYIHNNPVRRGLVIKPEDWLWSSMREWSVPGTGVIPIDRQSFPIS